jgi:mycofactocin system transcriptional regulator
MQYVKPRRGRPRATTHQEAAGVALDLFAKNGFETTTVGDIAAAIGIDRRTLFRYFPSKNDIVWGDFDSVLARLRERLAEGKDDAPMMAVLRRAAVRSNRYPAEQLPELRIRMTLITTVPSLQAHSMLRYAAWRDVVAEFAAHRLGQQPDDLAPLALGYAALGASMSAFSRWVANQDDDLEQNLDEAYALLESGFRPPEGSP